LNKLLFISIIFLKLFQKALTGSSLPKCEIDKNRKCFLSKSKILGNSEYCMDGSGNIYKGIGSNGNCIMVGYSEQDENDLDIRGIGSDDGNEEVGYFIKIEKNGKITNLDTKGIGKLYYCSSSLECNEVNENNVKSGYYRNADIENNNIPYIKCTKGSNNCEAIEITSNDCTISDEGAIIGIKNIDNSLIYKICFSGNAISLTHYGKYFVDISNGNVFGRSDGNYVMVEIADENALKNESEIMKYQYTDSDFKVVSKKENTEICKNTGELNVFKLVDILNYYYHICDDNE